MSTASTTTCPHCAAALVTEGLRPGTTIVCAGCGGAFTFGRAAGGPPASRKAVASLALGVASFVGMFLTGVPAMVLGIMALRDISRRPGQVGGRGLAVAGIILGGVFSFLCSPCAGLIAFSVAQQVRNGPRETAQPEEIRAIAAKIVQCDLPAGLTPTYGFEYPMQGMYEADFADTTTNSRGFVMLLERGPSPVPALDPEEAMRQTMDTRATMNLLAIEVRETREQVYQPGGWKLEVTEQLGTVPLGEVPLRKYVAFWQRPERLVGVMIFTPEPGLSEEEVRAFLESLR